MPNPKSILRVICVAAVTTLFVTACGGGGGTSSGGGAGAGSSAVSGNVTSFGSFAWNEPTPDATGASLLAAIGDFLVARAYAQSGLTVTVDGLTVSPDSEGVFRIEGVESGQQVVTISDGELTCTITIEVPDGSEVILEDISFSEGNCSVARIEVVVLEEPADEEEPEEVVEDDTESVSGGQAMVDVCHKAGPTKTMTITIAEPALPAHLGHGDTEGACTDSVTSGNGGPDDGEDGEDGNDTG